MMDDAIVDIERIEMKAWIDCYAAAPVAFASAFDLSAKRLGNIGLFAIKKSSMTLFNRSLGIGVGQSVDELTLESATSWLRDHCGPTWAIPLAVGAQPPELAGWLSQKGLTLSKSGIAKFRRATTEPAKAVECPYDVQLVTAAHAADFGITARHGFEMDEGFENWLGALCGRPNWRTYVAYDGSTPAGVGAMFIKDGDAWLGMGATLPAYRGKGVQSAMLARRINDAAGLGAKMLSIDTYHAGIGEPANDSHRNVLRAGFVFSYFRPQYLAN
jgi:GNAT superfamily N-acetyltransferase